jgi:HEPN domain-containing protein
MDPQVEQLLLAAEDDRATIQLDVPARVLGFHAQQAVEKLLKALIASHGSTFAWTHEIESLQVELSALGEMLPVVPFSLLSLQPYAVAFRYAAVPVLIESDRDDIRRTVDIVHAHIKGRIDALRAKP